MITNTLIPKASPVLPKAKRHKGNPKFPLFGKARAGKNAGISRLNALNKIAPNAKLATMKIAKIPIISPNTVKEISSCVSVEKIKAGTPKLRVNIPTIVVSKERPKRPQTYPMPAIKNSGAIIPAISKIRVTALNQNKLKLKM